MLNENVLIIKRTKFICFFYGYLILNVKLETEYNNFYDMLDAYNKHKRIMALWTHIAKRKSSRSNQMYLQTVQIIQLNEDYN